MNKSYRLVIRLVRLLTRAFFRRVEVAGLDNLPKDRGGILVSWHPNGLIDPGLVLARSPRRVAFGARHGLFKIPLLGWVVRSLGAVPIFRASDQRGRLSADERRAANEKSLDALAQAVCDGRFAALFPEGLSHDAPYLMELRAGAARLYYRARSLDGEAAPVIVPVGLHYDDKHAFRSNALVEFHPPLELSEDLDCAPRDGEAGQTRREREQALTALIEQSLREVVHATESWELHHLMHRARKLVRAERAARAGAELERPKMRERALGMSRVWAGYYQRLQTHPQAVAELRARLARYDATLRALNIEDHELDRDPRLASPWLPILLALQVTTVYLLLPPVFVVGWLVNAPVALGLLALTKLVSRARKDEATVKILVGALAFPLAWSSVGFVGVFLHAPLFAALPAVPRSPWIAGVAFALVAIVGGAVALRYLRVARETARAVRVRFFRRARHNAVMALRQERAVLFDAIMDVAQGLELPGQVLEDGRVAPLSVSPSSSN